MLVELHHDALVLWWELRHLVKEKDQKALCHTHTEPDALSVRTIKISLYSNSYTVPRITSFTLKVKPLLSFSPIQLLLLWSFKSHWGGFRADLCFFTLRALKFPSDRISCISSVTFFLLGPLIPKEPEQQLQLSGSIWELAMKFRAFPGWNPSDYVSWIMWGF